MARKRPAQKRQITCPSCGHRTDPGGGPLNFCPDCGADLRADQTAEESGDFIGRVIADRYRLIAQIGEGGMGAVYKAEHIRMGKALALKILRVDVSSDAAAVERFRAEAQMVSRLSHPHTIAVFDFGEIERNGGFYLAMEYVPGKDVATVLRESGPLPEKRAAEIGQQVLGSLAEAHDAGIVHRDMKPGNVMLMQTRSGEDFVKVLDFGIAKMRGEGANAAASTTSAGAIVGTPNYLAPEQARGDPVDARADLYAVGCLLYELASGRPPFVAPNPMAVVSAHLSQEPPALATRAPGASRRLCEVVHRALQKRPQDRFASADDMRDALLALGDTTGTHRISRSGAPEVTGALRIASRDDFRDFDRHFRSLRRSRVAAPLGALVLLAAVGAAAWRWDDLYTLLAERFPSVVRALPEPLRPSGHYDGDEHEPNDVPAEANPLPLPPGPDGRPGGGVAVVRGHVGAKLSDAAGDVDIFRLVVPPTGGRKVLVADWHGARAGEGIRGLDVSLALNREVAGPDGRTHAPLVAAANGGGPGRSERLVAAVEPGTYYLAVRERHEEATGPIEKPTDSYLLEVRLADPPAGEEVEPNDGPDRPIAGPERYPAWRAVAERNPLGEGRPVRGSTSPGDPDAFAVEPQAPGEAPRLVVAVPEPKLALLARLWVPDAQDLAPAGTSDRVRFEPAVDGAPGETIAIFLPAAPAAGAPAIVQLRAADGSGAYDVVALGPGARSGEAVLALMRALADRERPAQALEVAAAFATRVPAGSGRADVLLLAGRIAEQAAQVPPPAGTRPFERASQLLGAAVFEAEGGVPRYRGAFEALATGQGPAADEAALRLVRLRAPCTPAEVIARASAFLERRPAPSPENARSARILRARALEEAFWSAGGRDRARLDAALAAWKALAAGEGAPGEAAARVSALGAREPSRAGARPTCP